MSVLTEHSELEKRRRDIYAISLALIVYNFAGGSFNPSTTTTTLFGSVQIAYPLVLIISAWIAWAYFFWQFWLVARPIKDSFEQDVRVEILESERFRSYSKKLLQVFAEIAGAGLDQPDIEITTQELQGFVGRRIDFLTYSQGKKVFDVDLRDRKWVIQRPYLISDPSRQFVDHINVPKGVWKKAMTMMPWKGDVQEQIVKAARQTARLRQHAFSNRLLPMWIAWSAPVVGVARLFWALLTYR
jgi:hypothetical protein